MSVRQVRLALSRALAQVSAKRLGIVIDIAHRLSSRKDGTNFYDDLKKFVASWRGDPLSRHLSGMTELPSTIEEFARTLLYTFILECLRTAKTYILLAESEAMMSRRVSISRDCEGFVRSTQVVGMVAAYSKEKADYTRLTPDQVMEEIRDCSDEDGPKSEEDLIKQIVTQAVGITV